MKTSVRSLITRFALAATACTAFAAAVPSASADEAVLFAPSAPPPGRYEAVPEPRAGYAWDHGHWRWAHDRYVWTPGHWQSVRVGYHWAPGHWAPRGPRWVWVPGHWA